MEASEKNIAESLPEKERNQFIEAMRVLREGFVLAVGMKMLTDKKGMPVRNTIILLQRAKENEEALTEKAKANFLKKMHGKTVFEILQVAEVTKIWALNLRDCYIEGESNMCNKSQGIEYMMPDIYKLTKEGEQIQTGLQKQMESNHE